MALEPGLEALASELKEAHDYFDVIVAEVEQDLMELVEEMFSYTSFSLTPKLREQFSSQAKNISISIFRFRAAIVRETKLLGYSSLSDHSNSGSRL